MKQDLNIAWSGNPIWQAYKKERELKTNIWHAFPTWPEYCAFQLALFAELV